MNLQTRLTGGTIQSPRRFVAGKQDKEQAHDS
jgi:hypothetical protein